MRKKYKVKRINGVRVAVENKKWQEPMKQRIPVIKVHKDDRWPSRARAKELCRKETNLL